MFILGGGSNPSLIGLGFAIIVIEVGESCFEKFFKADPNGAIGVLKILSLAGLQV